MSLGPHFLFWFDFIFHIFSVWPARFAIGFIDLSVWYAMLLHGSCAIVNLLKRFSALHGHSTAVVCFLYAKRMFRAVGIFLCNNIFAIRAFLCVCLDFCTNCIYQNILFVLKSSDFEGDFGCCCWFSHVFIAYRFEFKLLENFPVTHLWGIKHCVMNLNIGSLLWKPCNRTEWIALRNGMAIYY